MWTEVLTGSLTYDIIGLLPFPGVYLSSTDLRPRLPRLNDCCYTGNLIKCPDLRRLCAGYLFSNLYLVVQATPRQQGAGAAEGPWRLAD